MKCLVIAPRFVERKGDYYDFPLGLAYISAALKSQGHEVHCLNLNHHQAAQALELVTRTVRQGGYSMVCSGGLSSHYARVAQVVQAVRQASSKPLVVLGGGLISSEPELMISALHMDVGVIGEGEHTIVDLAKAIDGKMPLEEVKGIVYRDQAGNARLTAHRPSILDLDSLPFPDFEGFEAQAYLDLQRTNDSVYHHIFDQPRMIPTIASRSCPFHCTFCFHPIGNKYRRRTQDGFFAEIDFLTEKYRINSLIILDELFSTDPGQLEAFCLRMKGYGLKWIAQLRVDQVDTESLKLMKDAGLFYISYGLESASDTVLASMKKKIRVEQIEKALALTRSLGIGIQGNFIFGDPAETLDTATQTISWWTKHFYYNINLSSLIPYPGSEVYTDSVRRGIIPDKLAYIESGCPPLNMTSLSEREYAAILRSAFKALSEKRPLCEVIEVQKTGYDSVKEAELHKLSTVCFHCGKPNVHENFHCRDLRYFKLICRHCHQPSVMSSVHFENVRQLVQPVTATLELAAKQHLPVCLTPAPEPAFDLLSRLQLLGTPLDSLNAICFLDSNIPEEGDNILGLPIVPLDEHAVLRLHKALFIIIPCADSDMISKRIQKMGILPERIIVL